MCQCAHCIADRLTYSTRTTTASSVNAMEAVNVVDVSLILENHTQTRTPLDHIEYIIIIIFCIYICVSCYCAESREN